MNTALIVTGLVMGLAGGPHCLVMCGPVCIGIGQTGAQRQGSWLLFFQAGRVVGYGLLGSFAAASMQGFGWLTVHSAALRPVWGLLHAAAMVFGLMLMVTSQQPAWLENAGKAIWAWASALQRQNQQLNRLAPVAAGTTSVHFYSSQTTAKRIWQFWPPLLTGVLWALLPCGLLYSALVVAALSSNPWEGGAVMAAFAVGTGATMVAGSWVWLQIGKKQAKGGGIRVQALTVGRWGIRLAGLSLFSTSAWILWNGIMYNKAPWCVT